MLEAISKEWQSQLFWTAFSAIIIPAVIYAVNVWRDRRICLESLSKIDCEPYLFYFAFYYDFLAQFAKGEDRPATSEFTLISFQNMSGHLLSVISSMRSDLVEAAKYAAAGPSPIGSHRRAVFEEMIAHLDGFQIILRTHEASIVGRAAVFPNEQLYSPAMTKAITIDLIGHPVTTIAELLSRSPKHRHAARKQQDDLRRYRDLMTNKIAQQSEGYAALVRWISNSARDQIMARKAV